MNEFTLRLKLLLRDRTATICYIAVCLVILFVIMGLNIHSEERSSLPIGLVTEDESSEARILSDKIRANDALYVYTDEFEPLYDMLLDGYINCIFVIKNGYGDSVRRGSPSETVMLYAAEDDKVSTIISDIVAGCMMYEICLDKAFVRYLKLEPIEGRNKLDFDAFSEYLETLAGSDEFRFAFDVKYVDGASGEASPSDITNGMIYRQMIAGMLAMLLMLVCFCSCNPVVSEFESGIRGRLKTVGTHRLKGALLEIAALIAYSLPVIVLISVMLFGTAGMGGSLRLLLIDLVFAFFCCAVFYLFAFICRSVFVYQLLGTVFLIVSGVTGFVSVFSGLMGTPSFSASPAACYIDAFIKYVLRA
ncbi:MAG: ABC transporter permease [Lachnospiraceae bacterium]|nr:ABC transporter permease [Lachnospiraceae bacterium]